MPLFASAIEFDAPSSEAANIVSVSMQLLDGDGTGDPLTRPAAVRAYLASDEDGTPISKSSFDSNISAGPDGAMIEYTVSGGNDYPGVATFLSSPSGAIEAVVENFDDIDFEVRLAVIIGNGSVHVSAPLAFTDDTP